MTRVTFRESTHAGSSMTVLIRSKSRVPIPGRSSLLQDTQMLGMLKVLNREMVNQAVFALRRHEDASLRYTGLESHEGSSHSDYLR